MSQPLIMSFRPDAAALCLSGHKTQTRRILRKGYCIRIFEEIVIVSDGTRALWSIGDTVAIKPGRTKKAIGRVRVTGLRYERLSSITDDDAAREFVDPPTREGYFSVWSRLYNKAPYRVDDDPFVVVIDFKPV